MNESENMSDYQNIIALSRYARWLDDKGRREQWPETVTRLIDFYAKFVQDNHSVTLNADMYKSLHTAITSLNVMPSMRALMTAGEALQQRRLAPWLQRTY